MGSVLELKDSLVAHLNPRNTPDDIEASLRGPRGTLDSVRIILQELCSRDDRFTFIYSSLEEFPAELLDLTISDTLISARNDADTGWERKQHRRDFRDGWIFISEIINSTIFELLHVFDIDITPEQGPKGPAPLAHLELLRDLYEKSKGLKPQPAVRRVLESGQTERAENRHPYSTSLDTTTGEVRVLEILPGTGKDPVECHLTMRKLYGDGIPEALSYVWGKEISDEPIVVDQVPFIVTKNLHRILRGLRHPDTARTVWIDAICINQSDPGERTHQVRLMRDIYSKAKCTIIWLGDGRRSDLPHYQEEALYRPLPHGFGGTSIGEYDLPAILERCQKYPVDIDWNKEQWEWWITLERCVNHLMLCEWWERTWTIQEAALPSQAPMLLFRGNSFSLDDFTSAMGFMSNIRSSKEHFLKQLNNRHRVIGYEADQIVYSMTNAWPSGLGQIPLAIAFRPGLSIDVPSGPRSRIITVLLALTATCRASNPLDKIFALESLLPSCMGRLICVDYDQDCDILFRDTTARSYNYVRTFLLLKTFVLLFESKLRAGETHTGPSWVIDFTYSDAAHHHDNPTDNTLNRVTLDGFLTSSKEPYLQCEQFGIIFATPKVLFCAGCYIDYICFIGSIPKIDDPDIMRGFYNFVGGVQQARNLIIDLSKLENTGSTEEAHGHANKLVSIPLLKLFSLQTDEILPERSSMEGLIKDGNRALVGKMYFITKQGYVGIATAPVACGDYLTWAPGAPCYFILRGAEDQNGTSGGRYKSRIVARAGIADGLVDMKTLIDSLPVHVLQIV